MNDTFPLPKYISLDFQKLDIDEQTRRADEFFEMLKRRRTIREYSDREVPFELIEKAIATAGTAPSGANMQPWRFVAFFSRAVLIELQTPNSKSAVLQNKHFIFADSKSNSALCPGGASS